jgi:hypothetical protein
MLGEPIFNIGDLNIITLGAEGVATTYGYAAANIFVPVGTTMLFSGISMKTFKWDA